MNFSLWAKAVTFGGSREVQVGFEKMERVGILPEKDGVCGGDVGGRGGLSGKGSDAFIDRSKVRILLCDNNAKSSEEVFNLLCKCSYQGIGFL